MFLSLVSPSISSFSRSVWVSGSMRSSKDMLSLSTFSTPPSWASFSAPRIVNRPKKKKTHTENTQTQKSDTSVFTLNSRPIVFRVLFPFPWGLLHPSSRHRLPPQHLHHLRHLHRLLHLQHRLLDLRDLHLRCWEDISMQPMKEMIFKWNIINQWGWSSAMCFSLFILLGDPISVTMNSCIWNPKRNMVNTINAKPKFLGKCLF